MSGMERRNKGRQEMQQICTWRKGNIAPAGQYPKVPDHLDQMDRRNAGFLQYFSKKRVLSSVQGQ
ncbi:hypothetical protein PHISCL_01632 [Aspergillus sclerotialis]|uniref:Uncharacterized protein n=1 Tax=Aspergillus sclerotialis TaxID=2070753 RepID=A0A3A2ZTI7_9EURO|nr:hypothetical protein PHISCL_01632 [Aspergillus sclerotialis]